MTEKNHFEGKPYADRFRSEQAALPNSDIQWLNDLRATSIERYEAVGLPGPKVEEWKYTNLSALKSEIYRTSKPSVGDNEKNIDEITLNEISGSKVVFVNGYFDQNRSNIIESPGIKISSLNDYVKSNPEDAKTLFENNRSKESLQNLNLALMTGGYIIEVDEVTKLAEPIQIIHVATDTAESNSLRTRNFISLAENSGAQIIERFHGENEVNYWRQNVTRVQLADGAALDILQTQTEGNGAIHMSETDIRLAADASLKHYSLNLGGKISRTEIKPTLNGKHGNVELRGAFLARDGAAHDVMTHMKHMVPECESDQVYRGVLDKGGKTAFQGKVYVAKDAQLTNADQSNKNLLLDRNAEANSKPELLIYADDVKCSHGATVGELDQEALFYLNARGLDNRDAKALLVEAFIAEVFEELSIEPVKENYLGLARAWLKAAV